MNLAPIFLSQLRDEKREAFASLPHLNTALLRLVEEGSASWPELRMTPAIFVSFLAHSLPAGAAAHLQELRAGDLWLACAYGAGIAGADKIFETKIIPPIQGALSRLGIPAQLVTDILQNLRGRMVEMQQPLQEKQGYSGRGDLAGWLYVCAVREANRRSAQQKREQALEDAGAALLPSPAEDPEMAYIQMSYKRELQQAFRDALASLTSKERNLLRYYFLEGMSIDKIGALYGVHRATAARWVNGAREHLCHETRAFACRRISLSEEGFDRILGLIESQIQMNLAMEPA